MNLYAYLIITLVCLSTTFAECPDKCRCEAFHGLLTVHCDNLQHLPLELITYNVTVFFLRGNNINVLSNIDERMESMTHPYVIGLSLANNHISRIEVNSLRVFTSLNTLDLSYNNISFIPNGLFETLPYIKQLLLSNNPNLILPENGFDAKELEYLGISYCNLQEIPLYFFDSTPNIKQLNLDGNHLSHLGSHLIINFQKMNVVYLEYNNLTVLQPELGTLLNVSDVYIALWDNPFRCDCQFKDGLRRLPKMRCVVPTESNNSNGSVDQEKFLESLDCDGSKNEDTTDLHTNMTSYNNSNESLHNNT